MGATPQDYYNLSPLPEHSPGDIWSDLPTHGLLPYPRTAGLVITPACDLSNRKVETVTYLPIVSVADALVGYSAIRSIKIEVNRRLEGANFANPLGWADDTTVPIPADLETASGLIRAELRTPKKQQKKALLERALAGIECLLMILRSSATQDRMAQMRLLYGEAEWAKAKKSIISNARPDTHFLPADGQPIQYAAVSTPSVALFRYALSAPAEIFDLAQAGYGTDWGRTTARLSEMFPIAGAFSTALPIKRANLCGPFISDLITRFTGTFSRLGSPDFSPLVIEQYSSEIDGIL